VYRSLEDEHIESMDAGIDGMFRINDGSAKSVSHGDESSDSEMNFPRGATSDSKTS
jgi:hypothetical protein